MTLRLAFNRLSKRWFNKHQKKWDVLPNDIYLVSYPRSGNTWIRYLLAYLLEPARVWNITNLNRIIPDIHEPQSNNWIERNPRILKSHKSYQPTYSKVVYLFRDGRDVAVSYFDYQKKIRGYSATFNQFFTEYLIGEELPYGSWQDHLSSWLFNDHKINIHTMQYEAFAKNTSNELVRLGKFLNYNWNTDQIAVAINMSTFDRIQADYKEHKSDTHWSKGFRAGVKGGPGKWREVLSEEQNELFWQIAGQISDQLGYTKE
jgi:hypothetical protein